MVGRDVSFDEARVLAPGEPDRTGRGVLPSGRLRVGARQRREGEMRNAVNPLPLIPFQKSAHVLGIDWLELVCAVYEHTATTTTTTTTCGLISKDIYDCRQLVCVGG